MVTGSAHELLVAGRIDGAGANQLEEEVLKAIRAGAETIYVNLSEATFLCSAGLRVLLQVPAPDEEQSTSVAGNPAIPGGRRGAGDQWAP